VATHTSKNEIKMVFHPENCLDCLVSERVGIVYECKFYGRSYMPLHGEKPPYCKVVNIRVDEAGDKDL
jgi:hypothetical protein